MYMFLASLLLWSLPRIPAPSMEYGHCVSVAVAIAIAIAVAVALGVGEHKLQLLIFGTASRSRSSINLLACHGMRWPKTVVEWQWGTKTAEGWAKSRLWQFIANYASKAKSPLLPNLSFVLV